MTRASRTTARRSDPPQPSSRWTGNGRMRSWTATALRFGWASPPISGPPCASPSERRANDGAPRGEYHGEAHANKGDPMIGINRAKTWLLISVLAGLFVAVGALI